MTGVADLLAAPRGRRACWELHENGCTTFEALRVAVDFAMYWQPPDEVDTMLRAAEFDAHLAPAAERLLTAPECAWWSAPLDAANQIWLDFPRSDDRPRNDRAGVSGRLHAWHDAELERNARFEAERRTRPYSYAILSGHWWSTPDRPDVVVTSRDLPDRGAVGLWLLEDFPGWDRAVAHSASVRPRARVYEIGGPGDWAELVRRFPLDVTQSRQPDWLRTTDRGGRWSIPDWPAVAGEFDAVHVSVFGYLTTAGRPVDLDGERATLLAGWAPDETFWLTDDAVTIGEPLGRWERTDADWTLV